MKLDLEIQTHVDNPEVTHVDLCAGYGGLGLGIKRVIPSLRTVAYSEIEEFPCGLLAARMEAGQLDAAPIWTDLRTFPWKYFLRKVDILSGGFPCQSFSAAGKRLADQDPRHLFPYIKRGVEQMQPQLVFLENVEGIISAKLAGEGWNDPAGTPVLLHVLRELERVGYRATWGVFSASEVGAPHQRKRVFILGVADGHSLNRCSSTVGWQHDRQTGPASEELAHHHHHHPRSQRRDGGILQECSGQRAAGEICSPAFWPSRPGEPQYGWEPPRVVADAGRNGRRKDKPGRGSEGRTPVRRDGEGAVENAERSDEARRESASGEESGGRAHDQSGGSTPYAGEIKSGVGMPAYEFAGALGEAGLNENRKPLPAMRSEDLSGLQDNILPSQIINGRMAEPNNFREEKVLQLRMREKKAVSDTARAREILQALWRANAQENVQRTTRGNGEFLAATVLRSGVQLGAWPQRVCYAVWAAQTGNEIQGFGLPGMWLRQSDRHSSQGSKPREQFSRELAYALCVLSYRLALERGEEAVEGTCSLQSVLRSGAAKWVVSETLAEIQEVWRSEFDEETWTVRAYSEAAFLGYSRVDELRLLGNGVVPATAERAFRVLASRLIYALRHP